MSSLYEMMCGSGINGFWLLAIAATVAWCVADYRKT